MIELIDNPIEPIMAISSVEQAVSSMTDAVKSLRDYKDNLDLVFQGINLQVGLKDRENITGRLDGLLSQQALGVTIELSSLFWRDSFNIIHTWTVAADYIAWLQGIIVAYGERRGLIYYTSWQITAALEAIAADTELSNEAKLTQILSYDITVGW